MVLSKHYTQLAQPYTKVARRFYQNYTRLHNIKQYFVTIQNTHISFDFNLFEPVTHCCC